MAVPLLVVVLLAVGWSGFWFYSANKAETTLTQWREREAKAGRIYTCDKQAMGGYPFRIELTCSNTAAEITDLDPRLSVKGTTLHVASQIYDPTLLIAEVGGPLTVTVAGAPPYRAEWTLAQMSARGTPAAPQRVSVVLDDPKLTRGPDGGGAASGILRAKHIEAHAKVGERTADGRPILDLAVELAAAEAPNLHPIAAQPFDLTATAVLRGLDNLRPLPTPARLKQLQSANGRLEITHARVHQGELTAVAVGTLGLTPEGRLNGELNMTVAGLDRVLPLLGLDQLVANSGGSGGKVAAALDKLDRVFPGLGRAARAHAGAGLAAGLAILGKPAELEGQKALALPLRFVEGAIYLGPLRVGEIKPLF
jgi:hypothetical protein